MLSAAALSTAACMAMIKLLDEPRIALYQKYNEMAEEVKIPQGGSYRNYVRSTAPRPISSSTARAGRWTAGKCPTERGT